MAQVVETPAEAEGFEFGPEGGSDRFGARMVPVGAKLGLSGLGISMIEVPPGKRAFPFHNHLGNDELFVILEGEGSYRYGAEEHPVRAGDVCAAPRGGPDTAHQLVNTGAGPLRYYAISTRNDPEIVEYPDSGKFACVAIWPGENFFQAHLRHVARRDQGLDYWDGETT
jgi:uncharacterized cupin superfamily protein